MEQESQTCQGLGKGSRRSLSAAGSLGGFQPDRMWGESFLLPSEAPKGKRDVRKVGRTSGETMEAGGEGMRIQGEGGLVV